MSIVHIPTTRRLSVLVLVTASAFIVAQGFIHFAEAARRDQISPVPSGAVMAFDQPRGGCPQGWSPYTPATGRVIVGTGQLKEDLYEVG
ncbi:MAG: hypothetical protein U9N14_05650, partial [Pseudomonadota bacterium]|nr:hypothetical protein [Pseudomonadota bacterium]